MSARGAAAITVVMTGILVLIPVGAVILSIIAELPTAVAALQGAAAAGAIGQIRVAGLDVGAQVLRSADAILAWLSSQAVGAVSGMTRATLNLVVALFGLYYLLVSGSDAWHRTKQYLPLSPENADRLAERFVSVTEAMLLGTVLTAVLQGTVVGLGTWIVGLRGALLWGGATMVVSVLPVLGSALVWVPASLTLYLDHRPGAAIALALIGLLVASNIDNVARLIVYRRVSGIHPMITLVGAIAGVPLFGLFGVLVGPLVLLYFGELVQIVRAEQEPDRLVAAAG